jgi:zinc-binding in reverse transcriptase
MVLWKFNATGIYSAKSFYDFYAGLGKIKWEFHALWKAAHTTVRVFYFLLLHDKLLTQQILFKRKITNVSGCVVRQCPTESALHLFYLCPLAVSAWNTLKHSYALEIIKPDQSIALMNSRA